LLCSGDIEEDDMMIPSELSSLPANQNGGHHGGGHFGEAMFQHAEQLVRSQLLGQLGQDQMQLLHSLQQLGRKQKEVSSHISFMIKQLMPTKLTFWNCATKSVQGCGSGFIEIEPFFVPGPDYFLLDPKKKRFF
jgi:hypothetical protein